ncbi:Uu.00g074960.m01.CDS01 [Anthostomella pinea]|uniref:Uu.00g074960.m01.CDS01 n=1 Tax=Anthostomella pinea TaxID=933095 RepID=A0AAI8YP77_9PEZI|nr:Uu.00g074960.m01.CDS01 [Anthostomella pinea]
MHFRNAIFAAAIPATFAAQQHVLANPTSVVETGTPSSRGRSQEGKLPFPMSEHILTYSTALVSASINYTESADTTETTETTQTVHVIKTITQPPNPITTDAADKPAFDASVMGLIVFSAAGLFLL